MSQPKKHGVAIVEDNGPLGESLRKIIDSSQDLQCSNVWGSAEDCLRKIEAFRPEVVLMDINLPGMSGIEATGLIKR